MMTTGIPAFCYTPSEMQVDAWYKERLEMSDKTQTWKRQLIRMDEDHLEWDFGWGYTPRWGDRPKKIFLPRIYTQQMLLIKGGTGVRQHAVTKAPIFNNNTTKMNIKKVQGRTINNLREDIGEDGEGEEQDDRGGQREELSPVLPSDPIKAAFEKRIDKKRDTDDERLGVCPALIDSDFFQHVSTDSQLHKYMQLLSLDKETQKTGKETIEFALRYCPPPERIDYSSTAGFFVSGEGERDWMFTVFEHGLALLQAHENILEPSLSPGWDKKLYHSLAPSIGAMDVDKNSIRFIASYETPKHHCKYLFHTPSSTPIPASGADVPHHTIPHYFYLSPLIRDTTGLMDHSCRGEDDDKFRPQTLECYLILSAEKYPSLSDFLNKVPSLLLCNITGHTSSLPKTFYEIYNEFKALGTESAFPSASVVTANYEAIVQTATKHHPHHRSTESVRFCTAPTSVQCPFFAPFIPDTNRLFVTQGAPSS